jgi:hypothetical protein
MRLLLQLVGSLEELFKVQFMSFKDCEEAKFTTSNVVRLVTST